MDYLSLCLLFKDENEYLEEWIEYHRLIGVERFYIYDNGSQISARVTLAPYVRDGLVIIHDLEGKGKQLTAYDHFIQTYRKNTFWAGFIDTDEYIVPKTCTDLRAFLREYEVFGGLAINWVIFGSAGHAVKPAQGQILSYTLATPDLLPENERVKSIVQPDKVIIPHSPHHFIYKEGSPCVNEKGYLVFDQTFPHSKEKIQINHYWCRSREEFVAKLNRGRGDSGDSYSMGLYEYHETQATIEDQAITSLISTRLDRYKKPDSNLGVVLKPDLSNWLEVARCENACSSHPLSEISTHPEKVITRTEITEFLGFCDQVEVAVDKKDHPATAIIFQEMVDRYPTSINLHCELANVYWHQQDPEKAWKILAGAWKKAPGSYVVVNCMSLYFNYIHQLELSDKLFHLAFQINPQGTLLKCLYAGLLLDQNKPELAFQVIVEGVTKFEYITKNHEMLDVIKKLGVYFYSRGDPQKVQQVFEIALRHHPEDYDLLLNLGKILFDSGDLLRAAEYLKKAAALKPEEEEAQLGLSLIKRIEHQQNPLMVEAA